MTPGEMQDGLRSQDSPDGLAYDVIYNPVEFIQASIDTVVKTMIEAVILVVSVVLLFLGIWRPVVMPIIVISVSLVGTFALMSALGYSINTLSLFCLVLAVIFVVLVTLASKNSTLTVEFAKQAEQEGLDRWGAAVEAAQTRLRPSVMISLAFILGVVALMMATGADAEMHQSLGVSVYSGMLGVTAFGLMFTPVFYVLVRSIEERLATGWKRPVAHGAETLTASGT